MNPKTLTLLIWGIIALYTTHGISSEPIALNDPRQPSLLIDFDECTSFNGGSQFDYTEFTAEENNFPDCSQISLVGPANVYRSNVSGNAHSCTPGVGNSLGMCIDGTPNCNYDPGSVKSLKFNVQVTPGLAGIGSLDGISFFEQAPDNFNFSLGEQGLNNYPQFIGIRVLANGVEVFRQEGIPTNRFWTFMEFDFKSDSDFQVSSTTVFNFEILPYCPVGNASQRIIWDIDQLQITGNCNNIYSGIVSTNDITDICANTGTGGIVEVNVADAFGPLQSLIVTDENNNIIQLPSNGVIDFRSFLNGAYNIYNVVYEPGLFGLTIGNNISQLSGCFDVSNALVVNNSRLNGGRLVFDDGSNQVFLCDNTIDGNQVMMQLSSTTGRFTTYILADRNNTIIQTFQGPEFDFSGFPEGIYNIVAATHNGQLLNSVAGVNISNLSGCFSLSNLIRVNKEILEVGSISINGSTQTSLCGANTMSISPIINGVTSPNIRWVVTDQSGSILNIFNGLPINISNLNEPTIQIRLLTFLGSLTNFQVNAMLSDVEGCYILSNPITVNNMQVNGGSISLEGGVTDTEVCVDDGDRENLLVTLTGSVGSQDSYIILDANQNILNISDDNTFNFENVPPGVCTIVHISSVGTLIGLTDGNNINDLEGCFDLSNGITVTRLERFDCEGGCNVSGGFLTLSPSLLCSDENGTPMLEGQLTDEIGNEQIFAITNTNGEIVILFNDFPVDVSSLPDGNYFTFNIASFDDTEVTVGDNIDGIQHDCFAISVEAVFTKVENIAGSVSLADGTLSIQICVSDTINDILTFVNDGSSQLYQYVVTDGNDIILDVVDQNTFDFTNAPFGTCRVWGVASSTAINIEVGEPINSVLQAPECVSLSDDFIVVERFDADGGMIELESNSFCVGDGIPDLVRGTIDDSVGNFFELIVTDADSTIISIPGSFPFDVDSAPAGTCLVWNIASSNEIDAQLGSNILDYSGTCFAISEPAAFTRTTNFGGTVSLESGATETEICLGDMNTDVLTFVNDGSSQIYQYVITDSNDIILDAVDQNSFDFSNAPAGICRVWGVASSAVVSIEVGQPINSVLQGTECISLSDNFIVVERFDADGGMITLEDNRFCVGDGISDLVRGTIVDTVGNFFELIVTDADSTIIAIPGSFPFDVETAPAGTCLVWSIASNNEIDVQLGTNISDYSSACFAISEPASFIRTANFGGSVSLEGGITEIEICVGDTITDLLTFMTTGMGLNYQYIITDTLDVIIGLPSGNEVNFNIIPAGICRVYGIAHNAIYSQSIGDVLTLPSFPNSCFQFSDNFIQVNKIEEGGICGEECLVSGGVITISASQFCVGDGEADLLDANVVGALGDFMQWVITDSDSLIVALPDALPVDLDGVAAGSCILWNIASSSTISLMLGQSIADIDFECFDISEANSFNRIENFGGNVSLGDDVVSIDICVTDTLSDILTFFNDGSANLYRYVITDENDTIIAFPLDNTFDFSNAPVGICRIYGIALQSDIELFLGQELVELNDINNCIDLSNNFIVVNRFDSGVACGETICIAEGGIINLDNNFFCVGDGEPDLVEGTITGSEGNNMQLIVTDADSIIIGLPNGFPIDVDNSGPGNCIIWNLASQDPIELLIGSSITSIQDTCFDLSIAAPIRRVENFGGMVSLDSGDQTALVCVGDSLSDILFFENTGSGVMYHYIVTDDNNTIIGLPDGNMVDFEDAGVGVCRVWGIAHEINLPFQIGDLLIEPENIGTCFDLSNNFVEVTRSEDNDACDACVAQRNTCTGDELGYIFDDIIVAVDSNVCIPLRVTNFVDVITFQGGMMWDSTVLQFTGTQNYALAGMSAVGSFNIDTLGGIGSFVWFDNAGGAGATTLADSSAVFEICFDVIGEAGDKSLLKVIDTDDTIIQVSSEASVLDFCVDDGCVTVIENDPVTNTFTLIADNIVTTDTTVCVDVTATNFVGISGMQFAMQWDSTFMCFDSITNNNESIGIFPGAFFQGNEVDRIRFTWNNNETTLPDNTLLFSVCLTIKEGNCDSTSVFNFIDDRVPIEISMGITPISFDLENGSVSLEGCTNLVVGEEISYVISPNPSDELVSIRIKEVVDLDYDLMVHNGYGELIHIKKNKDKIMSHEINVSEWPEGIYYMTIISKNKKSTKKFLVIHR